MCNEKSFNMADEFRSLDFESKRLEARYISTMFTFLQYPEATVLSRCINRNEAQAIYRMCNNKKFKKDEILGVHNYATIQQIIEHDKPVLVI